MTIDIEHEELLTIAQAAKRLPSHPHVSTVWRWVLYGVRGTKLESVLIGGLRYTSAQALERFVAGTTAKAAGQPAPTRTPRRRERAIRRAERELEAEGI